MDEIKSSASSEKWIRPSTDAMRRSEFACPGKLTQLGLSAFKDATSETLPFLEMLAPGEDIRASIVAFADEAQTGRHDDFTYLTSLYSHLGATCAVAGEQESAVQFFGKALEAAEETDFKSEENLPFVLGSLAKHGGADEALRHLQRIIHVKNDRRRVLSNLMAQVAFAMGESGATSQLEELLEMAPRQADLALICVGAAQGFLAAATGQDNTPTPRDAYEMLLRCNLPLPLPQARRPIR